MAFADVHDIEARIGVLSAADEERAATLLDDAAAILSALVSVDPDDDEQAELLKTISCNMVIRSMSAPADTFGVQSASMTAGAYSQTWQYANPSGDMYLTKLEKRLLGISSSYIGTIRPMMAGEHDD